MNTTWQERNDGYFFPNRNLSVSIESKLEMLSLDEVAQTLDTGTLIPFEKSVLLSEEDAELLNLPPRNPYQMSILTEGYIGGKNFKYVVEFLNPDGRPIVNPKINGAILHIGSDNIFRLNADQFALINLMKLGNETSSHEEIWLTAYQIQKHAVATVAKVSEYLSTDKTKIVVPDKLSVDFIDFSSNVVKVQPILLEKRNGHLEPIDSTSFQEAFGNRKKVLSLYRGKDGTRYVFTETLCDGLSQIKSVDTLSKADATRYKLQPKELFSSEAFDFSYSDRVEGVEEVKFSSYYNSEGTKINWLDTEEKFPAKPSKEPLSPREPRERPKIFALKIKENFERVDYERNLSERVVEFFADVLRPEIELLPHQKLGVGLMAQLWQGGYHGILLADDMGLGKTLQTLTFLAGLKKSCANYEKLNQPMLIVAPAALLTNWQEEYEKFLREKIFGDVIPLHGYNLKNFFTGELTPNGKRKLSLKNLPTNALAVTTYETLRDYQFSFAEISWSCIVADEAQKIKNPDAGITKALKATKYDFAICLSGTPVENSWIDLWSIMDFVQPAHLDDLKTFREKYLGKLTGDTKDIQRLGEELKNNLRPLFLRRMKQGNLHGLPIKKVFRCSEQMPSYQREIYSAVIEKYLDGGFSNPLEFLLKLREVSLHPDLDTMSEEKFFELDADEVINRSARLIRTFAILNEIKIRGEKVLIFVTSRKMQTVLKHLLQEKFGTKILPPINGTMNGTARQKFIDEFKSFNGFNVLILSPEAAGVGFTITEANNVIHLSRTWNPAKENQATDRVYRIGQRKTVNVYLPMTCDKNLHGKTFDENLDTLLSYKSILSTNVLFPTDETNADINTLLKTIAPIDEKFSSSYWTIEAVDFVSGHSFEQVICDLYNTMKNFSAEKTPGSNDFGADVVVKSLIDNTGFLIQCKHRQNPEDAMSNRAVQEIYAAVKYYEKKYSGRKFQPMVLTNAKNFTRGAIELAQETGVKLITRRELEKMFQDYKVLRC